MKKTYSQPKSAVNREWHLVDVKDQVLGRVATQISQLLMGKNKPTFSPHIDGGDAVVVINAAHVVVTRNKALKKEYFSHSLMPGGMKVANFAKLQEEQPVKIIENAVYSMLPKNSLRSARMKRLKIYPEATHPHSTHFNQ